jgi:hypothetical protein
MQPPIARSIGPGAAALSSLLSVVLAACDGGGSDAAFVPRSGATQQVAACTEPSDELPESYLFQVEGQFADVDHWDCQRPVASDGAFGIASVNGTEATVTGSSATLELEWVGPEDIAGHNLLFWFGGASNGSTVLRNGTVSRSRGGRGFYRYVIPDDANPMPLDFFVDPDANGDGYQLNFAIDDTIGDPVEPRVGTLGRQQLYVIEVGSGDIQINLNWNTLVDLDLHVIEPTDIEIYFGAPESPSGGMLDLDSYAGCSFTGDRGRGNENVFWPTGDAPSGEYSVQVHMWSDCGTYAEDIPTLYRATIVHGGEIQVVEGSFDPEDDADVTRGIEDLHEVATFVF